MAPRRCHTVCFRFRGGPSAARCCCCCPWPRLSCHWGSAMAGLVDFQNEEEVQEYLTNVGTEYSYQCYREKDPDGCHRLAEYFEGIKKNFDSAAQVLKTNCEQNQHSESCYKLGAYYITGKGGLSPNLKAAYDCFMKSCKKGGKKSIEACHNVGLLAHDGRAYDDKPDHVIARDYYTMACNGNFSPSCFNLSALYIQGAPGVPKDMSQALNYSTKACNLGHMWGCANASRMYKLGDGIDKDDAKAEAFKNKAKDLHDEQKGTKEITFGM